MGTFNNTFNRSFNQIGSNVNPEPNTIPFKNDLIFHTKERVGLTLVAEAGDDAYIKLPYYTSRGNDGIVINGAEGLNIGDNSFTLSCWVFGNSDTTSQFLVGRGNADSINGRYCIYAARNTKLLSAYIQCGAQLLIIPSNIINTGWHHCLFDVNMDTKVFRFFVDNVQQGAAVSFTNTPALLNDNLPFLINGRNLAQTPEFSTGTNGFSDCLMYHRILTDIERGRLYNRLDVSGADMYIPFTPCDFENVIDISGNNYHGVPSSVDVKQLRFAYSEYGSRVLINRDSTLYKHKFLRNCWMPYSQQNSKLISTPIMNGYEEVRTISPPIDRLPYIDCRIAFIGSQWDRSDSLMYQENSRFIWNIYNQPSIFYYYYSTSPTEFHITELNNVKLNNFTERERHGINFIVADIGSTESPNQINEILSYGTNKIKNDLRQVLTYCKDIDIWTEEIHKISEDGYYVCATLGNKLISHNGTDTLYLSNDAGVTWAKSLNVGSNIPIIEYGFIFDNGNIMLCTNTKVYHSIDNLDSIQQSTVIDIDGNPYIPVDGNNFYPICSDGSHFIDGVEMLVWGNYSIRSGVQYDNVVVWCTTDNGLTIKNIYKAGVTLSPTLRPARHVHAVNYDYIDDVFWLQTGDGTDECNWIIGTYNSILDSWSWEQLLGGSANNWYKVTGMVFTDDYIYWASDVTEDQLKAGIWRVRRVDVLDESKYEQLYMTDRLSVGFYNFNNIFCAMYRNDGVGAKLLLSKNGVDFIVLDVDDIPDIRLKEHFFNGMQDKVNGKIYFDYIGEGQVDGNYTAGNRIIMELQ